MDRENNTLKSLAAAGAATAFAGIALYAVGKTLSFLFRDVDPDRIERDAADEIGAGADDIENE